MHTIRGFAILTATLFTAACLLAAPAPASAAAPYSQDMPLAMWEVPSAEVPTAPTLGTSVLFKSFSALMNPADYLDDAAERGWSVVAYFTDTVDYATGRVYPERVAAHVAAISGHPALAGYLTVKEPSWSGVSVAEMRSLRNAFRAADPDPSHRIYADFGDSPHFGQAANPWTTGIADTLVMNWYPVVITHYEPGAASWFPKMRAYVDKVTPGTPIWIMVQTHALAAYNKRAPTAADMERQVGEAIRFARADGIMFYPWGIGSYASTIGTRPALQAAVAGLVAGIRSGSLVVRDSYDTTRPVMTRLSVWWSATARRWTASYHATDVAGISSYQVRWRLGTGVWHTVTRAGASTSVALVLPRGRVTVSARAVDKAGNWSAWRTVTRW